MAALNVRRSLVALACGIVWLTAAPGSLHASSADPEVEQSVQTADSPTPPDQSPGTTEDSDARSNESHKGSTGATSVKDELARQVANPAAPLTQIQLRNILAPNIPDTDGVANLFQVQPVVPIGPFNWFHELQLVRLTFQVTTLPDPVNESGFGDLQLFDLITFKTSWGHWGVGPYLAFPTAASEELGSGKYQAGPAVAVIYSHGNLTAGAILQNPVSIAGDPDRADVNQLIVQPTLTLGLSNGWFAGLSDFSWTFDWENDGAASIPAGVQVGKIVTVGKQPINLAVEIGRMAARPAGTPDPGWIIGFEISPLFNWHLGPGKKIRLRGKTAD